MTSSQAFSDTTSALRFAIITSQFNSEITDGLLNGALRFLKEKNILISDQDIWYAPGAFEIPLLAKKMALTKKFDGIIALGCVIKGDTAHFEFISLGASMGVQMAVLETQVPISFGILTTYTDEQAQARSKNNSENKGIEAAKACYEMALLLQKVEHIELK